MKKLAERNKVFLLGEDALRINVEVIRNRPTMELYSSLNAGKCFESIIIKETEHCLVKC